jgi:hypothetical protein
MEEAMRLSAVRISIYSVAAVVLLVVLVWAHDKLMCNIPSNDRLERIIFTRKRADDSRVLFRAEAKMNCLFTTEGPFHTWGQGVWIKFVDTKAFLNGPKQRFVYGVDFDGAHVRSGGIDVERKTGIVRLYLEFDDGYKFYDGVNGDYNLNNKRTLPLDTLSDQEFK